MTAAGGRRNSALAAVVSLVALVGVVGGVAAVRASDLIPPPAPPDLEAAPDLLDAEGLGSVRLGQRFSDFAAAVCQGASCAPGDLAVTFTDPAGDCTQYAVGNASPGSAPGWAWVRGGRVVAVGAVSDDPPGSSDDGFRTWPGLVSGAPLDPVPDELDRWERDTAAPVAVLRRIHDGTTTTLADVSGDGRLDYASVGTPEGEECRPDDGDRTIESGRPRRAPGIEGGTLVGAGLGMSAGDLTERGWRAAGAVTGGCRYFWPDSDVLVNGTAHVVDGVVIGLSAEVIVDGPAAGMTVDEATTFLDPATVQEVALRGFAAASTVSGTDREGRRIGLDVVRRPGTVAGLDAYVSAESVVGPGVVIGVTVGEACWTRGEEAG